jgi:hypothetical protein
MRQGMRLAYGSPLAASVLLCPTPQAPKSAYLHLLNTLASYSEKADNIGAIV